MIWLRWFNFVFPIVMISSPLLFVLLFRPRLKIPTDDTAALDKIRKLTSALWAATLVSLTASITAQVLFTSSPAASTAVSFLWMLFFPLWFGLVMPIVATKYPTMSTPHAQGVPTRSASLRPRGVDLSVSRLAWILTWGVWLVGVAVLGWSIQQPRDGVHITAYFTPASFHMITAVMLAIGPWILRSLAREAEPWDDAGSAELAEGYRALRQFRVRTMFYLMFVGFAVGSTALTCATAWGVSGAMLGIAGGVVGTTLGIAGGVFGTIAGIRRARHTEMLERLSTGHAKPQP
jgi:hypothetical protein